MSEEKNRIPHLKKQCQPTTTDAGTSKQLVRFSKIICDKLVALEPAHPGISRQDFVNHLFGTVLNSRYPIHANSKGGNGKGARLVVDYWLENDCSMKGLEHSTTHEFSRNVEYKDGRLKYPDPSTRFKWFENKGITFSKSKKIRAVATLPEAERKKVCDQIKEKFELDGTPWTPVDIVKVFEDYKKTLTQEQLGALQATLPVKTSRPRKKARTATSAAQESAGESAGESEEDENALAAEIEAAFEEEERAAQEQMKKNFMGAPERYSESLRRAVYDAASEAKIVDANWKKTLDELERLGASQKNLKKWKKHAEKGGKNVGLPESSLIRQIKARDWKSLAQQELNSRNRAVLEALESHISADASAYSAKKVPRTIAPAQGSAPAPQIRGKWESWTQQPQMGFPNQAARSEARRLVLDLQARQRARKESEARERARERARAKKAQKAKETRATNQNAAGPSARYEPGSNDNMPNVPLPWNQRHMLELTRPRLPNSTASDTLRQKFTVWLAKEAQNATPVAFNKNTFNDAAYAYKMAELTALAKALPEKNRPPRAKLDLLADKFAVSGTYDKKKHDMPPAFKTTHKFLAQNNVNNLNALQNFAEYNRAYTMRGFTDERERI